MSSGSQTHFTYKQPAWVTEKIEALRGRIRSYSDSPDRALVIDLENLLEDAIASVKTKQLSFTTPWLVQGQRFNFKAGDRVICNGYEGTISKAALGNQGGMVEAHVPGGITCVSGSYPDCYPNQALGCEVRLVEPLAEPRTYQEVMNLYRYTLHSLGEGRALQIGADAVAMLDEYGDPYGAPMENGQIDLDGGYDFDASGFDDEKQSWDCDDRDKMLAHIRAPKFIDIPHPQPPLQAFTVYLREMVDGDSQQESAFECQAEDIRHAFEQAENAYPGCALNVIASHGHDWFVESNEAESIHWDEDSISGFMIRLEPIDSYGQQPDIDLSSYKVEEWREGDIVDNHYCETYGEARRWASEEHDEHCRWRYSAADMEYLRTEADDLVDHATNTLTAAFLHFPSGVEAGHLDNWFMEMKNQPRATNEMQMG